MNTFIDWFSETIMISVYHSFFRNAISIVLLSDIVSINQSKRLFIYVTTQIQTNKKRFGIFKLQKITYATRHGIFLYTKTAKIKYIIDPKLF